MRPVHWAAIAGAAAVGLAAGAAWASTPQQKEGNTPPGWSYELRNGQRVPRVPRKTNPDGSWTEEIRQGNCTVTRTGRDGEVRETRKCD
ncbi:MAG TPA: hypothetical protein VGR19_06875 [Allosphingosinicella sp.]|nr:hypothetical protein [Allosphingosinicella sp.]